MSRLALSQTRPSLQLALTQGLDADSTFIFAHRIRENLGLMLSFRKNGRNIIKNEEFNLIVAGNRGLDSAASFLIETYQDR